MKNRTCTLSRCAWKQVCNLAMRFGETDDDESMSRPFGVSLLLAGVDKGSGAPQPLLYHTDPSGTFLAYQAKAIGELDALTLSPWHSFHLSAPRNMSISRRRARSTSADRIALSVSFGMAHTQVPARKARNRRYKRSITPRLHWRRLPRSLSKS